MQFTFERSPHSPSSKLKKNKAAHSLSERSRTGFDDKMLMNSPRRARLKKIGDITEPISVDPRESRTKGGISQANCLEHCLCGNGGRCILLSTSTWENQPNRKRNHQLRGSGKQKKEPALDIGYDNKHPSYPGQTSHSYNALQVVTNGVLATD
uniref:Uncharacterized protein n=1 Tax=Utricularia reniformis TaxID=192314 RepID=A0A1Y0AYZ4_9LAMI|nr:hypothetical protein AEK19_MT1322 [Utricularia reniformis]ART30371.1 hypothetical protein AEK19_MT1322 [Utricularia reniformis]